MQLKQNNSQLFVDLDIAVPDNLAPTYHQSEELSCSYCEMPTTEHWKQLQCGHVVHNKCIVQMIRDTHGGDHVDCAMIYKDKLFNINIDENYMSMCMGISPTQGIIKCPACNVSYSVLTPIYRDLGIPKKIDGVAVFVDDNFYHHLCTTIDLIHYINKEVQKDMLTMFSYESENSFRDRITDHFLCDIVAQKEYENHAVNIGGFVAIMSKSKCLACKHAETNPIIKHGTVQEMIESLRHSQPLVR